MRSSLAFACVVALSGRGSQAECRDRMVRTGTGACIDVYEWPNALGARPLLGASALPEVRDAKRGEVWDADGLCRSVGKRVCDRDEWVTACLDRSGSRRSWDGASARRAPHPCNTDKKHRAANEKKVHARDAAEMARLDQSEPSGSRETCVSASGARDMIGNVEEWVRCPGIGAAGWCLMGRFWAQRVDCRHTVATHHPRWHYYETGFRCCADQR